MHEVLRQALEPVLRDIRATGMPEPEIEDNDWTDDPNSVSAMLWAPDRGGQGVFVELRAPEVDRIAAIADQVQAWVVEQLWATGPTTWPPCPHHRDGHPLTASVHDGRVSWTCPADGTLFAPIGSLAQLT